MSGIDKDIASFVAFSREHPRLNWYAIADSAQCRTLPLVLLDETRKAKCLLGAPQDSPIGRHAPHLVQLSSPSSLTSEWRWIGRHARETPCISIMASKSPFDLVFDQLSGCAECCLPDDQEMFLAYWDPAILGSLIGQSDDKTLHVKGPVLDQDQWDALTCGVCGWWYWGRTGVLHTISLRQDCLGRNHGPFILSQIQVDELIEASVPDHIVFYIQQNNPKLLSRLDEVQRYQAVQSAVGRARDIRLTTMRDLVNYVCLDLIYGARMREDSAVVVLMGRVGSGGMSLDDAIEMIPQ